MSIRASLIIAAAWACLCMGPAPRAVAADPELRLPLDSLQRAATESVNVTLGRWPLGIASWALSLCEDAEDRDFREAIANVKAIKVRSFKFDGEHQYDLSIVDELRNQLAAPGWSPVAQVHQRGQHADNVDVYLSTEHGVVNGLAIIASGPRELTIVNIVGSIDPAQLAKVSSRLGLPALPM